MDGVNDMPETEILHLDIPESALAAPTRRALNPAGDNTQLTSFENTSRLTLVNVKQENSPPSASLFLANGEFQIFGYNATPEPEGEHQLKEEMDISTPFKSRYHSRLQVVTSTPDQLCFEDDIDQYILEYEAEPLESPVYARVYADDGNQPGSKRRPGSKIPQALPLQKVSKRKLSSHLDQAEWDLEECDEEVIILMDGILTKVGKPSGGISSGKILSTVQNCPITVKWLLENFESMVGQSLPRSFVYDQYVHHCGLNKIDSVNAASFGKLIRSVFLGLRTRRLGTRGNSKYHYYGIKIKESSHLLPILNSIRAEQDLLNDTVNGRIRKRVRRTQSVYTGKHVKGLVIDKKVEIQENLGSLDYQYPNITIQQDVALLPAGIDETSVSVFEEIYKRHCMKLVEFFHGFKLIDVLSEIANFWRLSLSFKRKNLEDYATLLSKPMLFKITTLESVETFIIRMDLYTYQHIINILIPNILRPLPLQMLQAIDNMIQDILGVFTIALNGFPKRTAHGKLRALTSFIRIWKQYSKLSQLSEFVELTLENESAIAAMRHHITSTNLEHLCNSASLIIESEAMTSKIIFKIMHSFSETLQNEPSLEQWCVWAYEQLIGVANSTDDSIAAVEHVTAELQSFWLILSNLLVNSIREMFGFEASYFVPMLQWCGELMQYFRQRLLDNMKEVMPITRFHVALADEDMSVSFFDKHKAKPLATVQVKLEEVEEAFPMPLFIPTSVRLLDSNATIIASKTHNS